MCYNKFIKEQETDWYVEKGSNGFNLFGSVAAVSDLLFVYKYSRKMVLTKQESYVIIKIQKRKGMIQMKVLMTPNSIISLENVRRVERREHETKHTSYGKTYTLTRYEIVIIYTDDTSERLDCGTGNNAKDLCDTTFQTIYNKLSEG